MSFPFNEAFRATLAARLAAFPHAPNLPTEPPLKHAAVAIALTEAGDGSGEAVFLLTRRAAGLRSHGGQWALPGGRCDPGETAREAARRECAEELGLSIPDAAVLGAMDGYPTRSGYRITPVVAWAGPSPVLAPNPAEVASVHRIALSAITRADVVSFTSIPESARRVVRLRIGGDHIHAPTAALLYQFAELLQGRHTRVADLEQPVFAWR